MVSHLPATRVGLVPGGTRATLILALFYVATSLGLPGPCLGPAGFILGAPLGGAGVLFTGVQLRPPIAGLAVGGHLLYPREHRPTDEAWTFLNIAKAGLDRALLSQ